MKHLIIAGLWLVSLYIVHFFSARMGYVCGWKDRGYKPHEKMGSIPPAPEPPKRK